MGWRLIGPVESTRQLHAIVCPLIQPFLGRKASLFGVLAAGVSAISMVPSSPLCLLFPDQPKEQPQRVRAIFEVLPRRRLVRTAPERLPVTRKRLGQHAASRATDAAATSTRTLRDRLSQLLDQVCADPVTNNQPSTINHQPPGPVLK